MPFRKASPIRSSVSTPTSAGAQEDASTTPFVTIEGTMRTSQEIDKIAAAIVKVQAALTNPPRNKTVTMRLKAGGEFAFKYATLDSILDLIRPVLAANELAVLQGTAGGTAANQPPLYLTTRLLHSSGQFYETDTPIPYNGGDAPSLGIALTYTKRYSITAMLGFAAEEDSDAGGTEKRKGPGKGSAAEGTGDRLDEPTRNRMADVATIVEDLAKQGKFDKAKDEWESSDFKDSTEAKLYAWSLLPSRTRSTIKALQEADRANAKAA